MSDATPVPSFKSCPWCGPKGELVFSEGMPTYVYCLTCGAECPVVMPTAAEAAIAWNERPREAALLAACKEAAAFFDEIVTAFGITNTDAQAVELRNLLRSAIASVEPQPERPAT